VVQRELEQLVVAKWSEAADALVDQFGERA
jgi:hypothetical protein